LRGEKFPTAKFSLGRYGVPINIAAMAFLIVAYIFLFFPAAPHPDAASMNWAILVYGAVLVFAWAYYMVKGRHEYDGPVNYVRWQGEVIQST